MKQALLSIAVTLALSITTMAFNPDNISTVALPKPVWLLSLEDPTWVTSNSDTNLPSFAVLSFSVEKKNIPEEGIQRNEDDIGRTSRSLPLYLAERILLETHNRATFYCPIYNKVGPAVSGKRGSSKELSASFNNEHRFIITGHFETDYFGMKSTLSIYLYDSEFDEETLLSESTSIIGPRSEAAIKGSAMFLDNLKESGLCEFHAPEPGFERPTKKYLKEYLDGLGQLFSQTLVQNKYTSKDMLFGEYEMLNWYNSLCQVMPKSKATMLMYIRGVLASLDYGSTAYKDHVAPLTQYLRNLSDPSDVINQISPFYFLKINQMDDYKNKLKHFQNSKNKGYRDWLKHIENNASNQATESTP